MLAVLAHCTPVSLQYVEGECGDDHTKSQVERDEHDVERRLIQGNLFWAAICTPFDHLKPDDSLFRSLREPSLPARIKLQEQMRCRRPRVADTTSDKLFCQSTQMKARLHRPIDIRNMALTRGRIHFIMLEIFGTVK